MIGNNDGENAVRLDPLVDTDIDWITAACQDEEIQHWTVVPRPYHRHHAVEFVATGAGEFRNRAVRTVADLRPVGMISIHSFDAKSGTADIGYWVAPWARRRGVARAAITLLCTEIRAIPGAKFVLARIAETNVASRRTVESCGFELTGVSATETCPDGTNTVAAALYRLGL
ncbi:MAG: N-acetyltransferase [Actinobacteria bacterium]|nr:N-acetyltransferase [Actinomycetota bacterium]NBP54076.1 N-acetyltransferase [Actinomycetota bacterium]